MTRSELVVVLPLIVLAAALVAVMLAIAVRRQYQVCAALTFLGLALAFAMLPVSATQSDRQSTPLFIFDDYALFYMGLLFATAAVLALLSYEYLRTGTGRREEFWILLLLATLGSSLLVASRRLAP